MTGSCVCVQIISIPDAFSILFLDEGNVAIFTAHSDDAGGTN